MKTWTIRSGPGSRVVTGRPLAGGEPALERQLGQHPAEAARRMLRLERRDGVEQRHPVAERPRRMLALGGVRALERGAQQRSGGGLRLARERGHQQQTGERVAALEGLEERVGVLQRAARRRRAGSRAAKALT